ncbi:MAG TPA: DUF559 domain-containing protein [Jatrophihabitantaceae bacterium]|jgi:very-short-patch-repair endonuclease
MLPAIDALLTRAGGVASHRRLLSVATRSQVHHEIRTGQLVRVFPDAYCRPWDADIPAIRHRAALICVGLPSALSHVTALERWGVSVRGDASVHVVVSARRHPSGGHGLVVHRLSKYPPVVRLDGLPTVNVAGALVQSWQLLGAATGRAPLIEAYRRRLLTAADLRQELDRATRLRARRAARELLALLTSGCESELEIWGLLHVFDAPGLRHGTRQRWVRANGKNYRIDIAFDEERVAVELDGSVAHGSREQREADVRRDAALASGGWLTVRFTYDRLTTDPDGCRRDLLATLAARRRWLDNR